MTNAAFFVYLFASGIGIAIVALLLLIFKVKAEKALWKNLLLLFVIVTFLLGLLYFGERFYTGNYETKGGWSAAVRALDLILASAQIFLWCWYLRAEAGLRDRRIAWGTNGILIGIFAVQSVIYLFLMDEHYYIESVQARFAATAVYIVVMCLMTVILSGHMLIAAKRVRKDNARAYLIGISLLLLFDVLGESFYCIMLFGANPILEKGLYAGFDLVSVCFLLINLLVVLYIYRCEIRGMMPLPEEEQEKKQEEALREALQEGGLSERELEVALLLLAGESYEEIAGKLNISRYTVKRHAHNIYQKLDVGSKVDLINRFRWN